QWSLDRRSEPSAPRRSKLKYASPKARAAVAGSSWMPLRDIIYVLRGQSPRVRARAQGRRIRAVPARPQSVLDFAPERAAAGQIAQNGSISRGMLREMAARKLDTHL